MVINELFNPVAHGYRSEKEDQSTLKIRDSRKTRLTLAQLQRLRILNDVRSFEKEKDLEKIKKQYAAPAQSDQGMGGLPPI